MDIVELKSKTIKELTTLADELQIPGVSNLKKSELIFKILEAQTEQDGTRDRHLPLRAFDEPDPRRRASGDE